MTTTQPDTRGLLDRLDAQLLQAPADLRQLTAEEQYDLLACRVADMKDAITPREGLLALLRASKRSGVPLKVKFGIDPTGPDIHVGHAVSLLTLSLLQRMGHRVQFVVGDFTAMIGDPSGRASERPALTREMVLANMASYEQQASRLVRFTGDDVERHFNSTWMNQIQMAEWINVLKAISASEMLQREDFRKRIAGGAGISLAELEYAVFMGYDSVILKPDIELGGVDQFLNLHMCRNVMEIFHLVPEVIIAFNLLPGTTGEKDEEGRLVKMSKSRHNYLPLLATARDTFGKVMSIPDEVMWIWFRELTELPPRDREDLRKAVEDGSVHPKEAKQLLARAVVFRFQGGDREVVEDAERDFTAKFGGRRSLADIEPDAHAFAAGELLIDAVAKATQRSKTEVRRLAANGAIKLVEGGEGLTAVKPEDLTQSVEGFADKTIKIGKTGFVKFVAAS